MKRSIFLKDTSINTFERFLKKSGRLNGETLNRDYFRYDRFSRITRKIRFPSLRETIDNFVTPYQIPRGAWFIDGEIEKEDSIVMAKEDPMRYFAILNEMSKRCKHLSIQVSRIGEKNEDYDDLFELKEEEGLYFIDYMYITNRNFSFYKIEGLKRPLKNDTLGLSGILVEDKTF